VPWEPELAVQNGPRLVEGPGRLGIRSDDGKRAARTVACDVGGRLHLVVVTTVPHEGPTLHETARLCAAPPPRGLGCRAAINLDGGPSTGFWVPPGIGLEPAPPRTSISYGLAVVTRSSGP
jgi:hypothetical protein